MKKTKTKEEEKHWSGDTRLKRREKKEGKYMAEEGKKKKKRRGMAISKRER